MDLFMELAFVAAVGGVGFEDVTVSGFQFFQYATFVYHTGATVIGECAEKNRVFAIIFIKRYEFCKVFSEKRIGLCLGELDTFTIWFSRLHLMSISNVCPVFGVVLVSNF